MKDKVYRTVRQAFPRVGFSGGVPRVDCRLYGISVVLNKQMEKAENFDQIQPGAYRLCQSGHPPSDAALGPVFFR